MAWVRAYDLTGDRKYLDEAVIIANYVHGYWDTSACGGGVWWDRERTYKNAVTIGLYVRLTAALHNRMAGDTTWLNWAVTGWNWFARSGMINSANLVNDGINRDCGNNGQTVHTYNQGLAIGGAVEVWRATGDAGVLATGRRLADAAMSSPVLTQGGILTESCDAPDRTCDDNGKQFKGIFMRYLMDLADATGVANYRAYARTQSDRIWSSDRDALNRIGQRWTGLTSAAYPNARDWRTQASGLGALLAATDNPGGPTTPPPTTPPPTTPPPATPPPTTPPPTTPPPTSPPPTGEAAWAPGVIYPAGVNVTYGGVRYQCRQTHTSLVGWEPPNVPALWLRL